VPGRRRHLAVEADGGSRGNPGPAAYGALVRDARTGEVLAERSEAIGTATNNVAEYRGLVAGLSAARELDPAADIEVRMDSELVIKQMTGRYRIRSEDLQELAAAASKAFDPDRVRYTWVPREENAAADRLVNAALDASEPQIAEHPPVRVAAGDVLPANEDKSPGVDEGEVAPPVAVVAPRNRIVGWASDLGTPTTLILLRHGETAHTVARVFSGQGGADPPLAESGFAQARAAAAVLAARGDVVAIVSSPMLRCRQTAQATADLLGLEVEVDEGFAEAGFGKWDGRTLDEVAAGWPAELEAWLASTAVAPPGGESLDDVAQRVQQARDRTIARHAGGAVVVAAHVNPIKTLVRLALGAPPSAVHHMELGPASLSEVRYYPDTTEVLRAFSVVAHLAEQGEIEGR
jgi:broad specificity phosphatase PhoE/ribonuclease HI